MMIESIIDDSGMSVLCFYFFISRDNLFISGSSEIDRFLFNLI